MRNRIISVLLLILGLILAIVPLNTDCASQGNFMKNGMVMPCHYTAISLTIVGIAIIILAIIILFVKKPVIRILAYILQIILSGFSILVLTRSLDIGNGKPLMEGGWKLGLCGSTHMSCLHTMRPISLYVLVGIMVLTIIGLLFSILGKKES